MPDPQYFQKTGHHFDSGLDPGEYDLTIPPNANQNLRNRREAQHTALKAAWDTTRAAQLALKNLIVQAVDDAYLAELYNPDEGDLTATPELMLTHLFDRYGNIAEHIIQDNKATIDEPFDPAQPFAVYTRRIEHCQQLATDKGTPYTDAQLVQIGIMAITKTGLFNDDYLRWRQLGAAQHTWANFKSHFNAAHTDWRDLSRMTAQQAGFQANSIGSIPDDLSVAMDNLALAATADKAIVEALTRQLEQAQQEIVRLLQDNRQLQTVIMQQMQHTSVPHSVPPLQHSTTSTITPQQWVTVQNKHKTPRKGMDPDGYCWTHGFRVAFGHSSATCYTKADGHKDEATRHNNMGGNQRGKPKK